MSFSDLPHFRFSDLSYTQLSDFPYGDEIQHYMYRLGTNLGMKIIKLVARYKDRSLANELHALANTYDPRPNCDPRPYAY